MSEKIYALLLRLYPAHFRRMYGEEALQLVRDRMRDEQGTWGKARLWWDLLADLAVSAPRVYGGVPAQLAGSAARQRVGGVPSFWILEDEPVRTGTWVWASVLSLSLLVAVVFLMDHGGGHPLRLGAAGQRASAGPVQWTPKQSGAGMSQGDSDVEEIGNGTAREGPRGTLRSASDAPVQVVAGETKLDAAVRDRVIQAVASDLVAHYVDPEKAHEASESLLSPERRGEFDAFADGSALAEQLTHDIQSSTQDSRLVVQYSRNAIPDSPPTPSAAEREEYRAAMLRQNCTVEKVQVLSDNIGYIKFNFFPDATVCGTIIRASMEKLDQSNAIIFDLRDSTGGFPDMAASVAGELFDRPVLWYNPRATPNASVLSPDHNSKLGNMPLYILTSSRTFSGAEDFTYDLKMLKRATVIGETTRGGHPGVVYHLDDHFWMAVPEARKPSPYGTLDWEGIGVEPDVKVKAADALGVAERLAEKKVGR